MNFKIIRQFVFLVSVFLIGFFVNAQEARMEGRNYVIESGEPNAGIKSKIVLDAEASTGEVTGAGADILLETGEGYNRSGNISLKSKGKINFEVGGNFKVDFNSQYNNGNALFNGSSSFKMGIGTENPLEKLHVNGNIKATDLKVRNINSNEIESYGRIKGGSLHVYDDAVNITSTYAQTMELWTPKDILWLGTNGASPDLQISNGGNVGIGVTDPTAKLDVKGKGKFSDTVIIGDPNGARTEIRANVNPVIFAPTNEKTIDLDGNWKGGGFVGVYRDDVWSSEGAVNMHAHLDEKAYKVNVDEFRLDGADAKGAALLISVLQQGDTKALTGLQLNTTNSVVVIGEEIGYEKNKGYGLINKFKSKFEDDLYADSNVGIGTTNIPANYKLAVAGKVISEEVKVQLSSNWFPDYVFKNDYILPSLKEVETYINQNGHLENIPSAEEVEKEGGILIGEMNVKLLEKIEELTLYTIQQEKKIKKLETQNIKLKELSKQLLEVTKRLEKLESK